MPYTNAQSILPPELLEQIQAYVQGTQLYVPRVRNRRLGWGMKNGTRQMLDTRNGDIRSRKSQGWSIERLAEYYHLSADTIRKIVYSRTPKKPATAQPG